MDGSAEAPIPEAFEEVRDGVFLAGFRRRCHRIIFKTDTRAGRAFDIVVVWAILISVATVILESVAVIRAKAGLLFEVIEWTLTLLFTIEYFLRLFSLRNPFAYARSFFGLMDLFSILPTYLALFMPGAQASRKMHEENRCPGCGADHHDNDALFCRRYGVALSQPR